MSGLDEQPEEAFICKDCGSIPYWFLVGFSYEGHKILGVILSDNEIRRTGKKTLHGISHERPHRNLSFFRRMYWWFQMQCPKCGKYHGGSFKVHRLILAKINQLTEEDFDVLRIGVDWP